MGAFQGCCSFTGSLHLSDMITSIDKHAFEGCYGFDGKLYISKKIRVIKRYAFYKCFGFQGVKLSQLVNDRFQNVMDFQN